MSKWLKYNCFFLLLNLLYNFCGGQTTPATLEQNFKHPPQSAKPWVFWYWMQGAVSKEGITADLEAMKSVGIGGAYLMPIKDTTSPVLFDPPVRQLTPAWWSMMRFAMEEARRLGLQIAMHASDGFALAGGPWITPELSMQKVVYTKTLTQGGRLFTDALMQPETNEGYYKDIAIYAYPVKAGQLLSTKTITPIISNSKNIDAGFLAQEKSKESFKSDSACWIQYAFNEPFTCRSVIIRTNGNNYQAQRLIIESGDDGIHFTTVKRLIPPRHGWQDGDAPVTHSIPATTAKYFRFVYDKTGTEPGAEDLDAAKWKPSLKVSGIELSQEPFINQYESKNGVVWRISEMSNDKETPDSLMVPLNKLINITANFSNGKLSWKVPPGNWIILRMGHTSTGHMNETGGGGKGLECDKFNEKAITLQFNNWFGKAIKEAGPDLAKEVLKVFHVDSWECGSQNWSDNFADEFKKRRGYELLPYLPVMAGLPVDNLSQSEKVLYNIRQTIAELVNDIFFKTMAKLAHENDCSFTAESVAPTMMSDGMLHYSNVDIPMGEFWLRSPTHDKPNDMLDAISGAHIYGKNIIQAEGFTELRMAWDEYPGMLKTLGDRNFALGINRLVLHVFAHNPWMNKKPGMTLDGVGLYFQRDQTWFKQSKVWIDYIQRCQTLLQFGKPVADIAVYAGDQLPRRAVLPEHLLNTLPGIFGKEKVESEKKRLSNTGEPLRTMPDAVTASANIADPQDWIDPLHGYAYDSFNPDVLMKASVKDKRIVLPGGASYSLLLIPGQPLFESSLFSDKLLQMKKAGAIIINKYDQPTFKNLAVEKDIEILENDKPTSGIAWNHRAGNNIDIYFISNQKNIARTIDLSFRINEKIPELFDPQTGEVSELKMWSNKNARTYLPLYFNGNAALFVVFRYQAKKENEHTPVPIKQRIISTIARPWQVRFDTAFGGPSQTLVMDSLYSWTSSKNDSIKYYSGTAVYNNHFTITDMKNFTHAAIDLTEVNNIATVKVNGIECGIAWTAPYRVDISKAIKKGNNEMSIEVTNTWANRLIGDHLLPDQKRITSTVAPYRLEGKPLLKAGLVGPVTLILER